MQRGGLQVVAGRLWKVAQIGLLKREFRNTARGLHHNPDKLNLSR